MWKVTRRLDAPCDSRPGSIPASLCFRSFTVVQGSCGAELPIMEGKTDRESLGVPTWPGLSISTSRYGIPRDLIADPSLPHRAWERAKCKARVVSMWR
jgi:hypothetical protein